MDWNNDGKKDLITGTYYAGNIRIYLNVGTDSSPSFSSSTDLSIGNFQFTGGSQIESSVEVVDWNNDGKKDVLFGVNEYSTSLRNYASYVYLALNTGSDSSPSFSTYEILEAGGEQILYEDFAHPVVYDWNRDGKKDLLVASRTNISYYINTGTDRSPVLSDKKELTLNSSATWFYYLRPEVNDWNSDGQMDLLVGSYYGTVEYFEATATGSYIIAYWDFDDGSGISANDTCSGGYYDIALSGASWSSDATPVLGGSYAVDFDGVDDYGTVGNGSPLALSNFTIQAWIYPDSLPSDSCALLAKGGGETNSSTALKLNSAGRLVLSVGGVANSVMSSSSIPVESWTHVAATYDGATARIYTNGVIAGSASVSTPTHPENEDIIVGALSTTQGFYDGRVDELKIFNYARSSSDIFEDGSEDVSISSAPNDYNGDGISDMAIFDNATGSWYVLSADGSIIVWATAWGWDGADAVSGDYDGDGIDDLTVFDNNSGSWYVLSVSGEILVWGTAWGWNGAVAMSGDYDGDGIDDLSVFDSNTGAWYILSVAGDVVAWATAWGWPGAEPVSGDYNGDGISDLAVFDQNTGNWYVMSLDGAVITWAVAWGWPGAIPVSGDYNGDGKDDFAVFDSNTGNWYILSVDGDVIVWATAWGWVGAEPIPGDYNGDGVSDLTVFDQNSGLWYSFDIVSSGVLIWGTGWGWPGADVVAIN